MADSAQPDNQLIAAYLGGDQAAFATLYERYRRPLYSYLNRMMPGKAATVDDLYQKTWLKAIDHLERYEDRQTFFAWLCRIAHNTAIDQYRRDARQQMVPIDDVSLADEQDEPWQQLSEYELGEALQRAIEALPEEQREVVLLRRQGTPFKDIAELQACSLNTALGRMRYAINNLRQHLQEWSA